MRKLNTTNQMVAEFARVLDWPAPQLSLRNLIDNETGETNLSVLKAMARRRAISETGFASPRAIRDALAHYRDFILPMQAGWRQAHGLPVATTMVTAFGKHVEGTRWSAF